MFPPCGSVLLVDDDEQFASALRTRVEAFGARFSVHQRAAGRFDGYHDGADVVVVATSSLGDDATEVVRSIRALDQRVLLIIRATAPRGVDAVVLFEAGADDYLSVHDDLTIIEARVRRALSRRRACDHCRRRSQDSDLTELAADPGLPDELGMTRVEERLWNQLVRAHGEVVPITALMESVWRRSNIEPKLLYEHVSKLRSRVLERGWNIQNTRGTGYRLVSISPRDLRTCG